MNMPPRSHHATYRLLEKKQLQDAYIRPCCLCTGHMTFALNEHSHLGHRGWEMAPSWAINMRIMTPPSSVQSERVQDRGESHRSLCEFDPGQPGSKGQDR